MQQQQQSKHIDWPKSVSAFLERSHLRLFFWGGCVSFLRNTKSAALVVSDFEKRNIRVPRAVSPAIQLDISFPSLVVCGASRVRSAGAENRKYTKNLYVAAINSNSNSN